MRPRRLVECCAVGGVVLAALGVHEAHQTWRQTAQGDALRSLARPGDVVLYTTHSCPYCRRARQWLNQHQVSWRECNIEADAACMGTYQAQGAPGVPLVFARGEWQLGFRAEDVVRALQATPPAPDAPASAARGPAEAS